MYEFSENLKRLLVENNMTQQKLASYLGATQATISRWVNGITEPDYSTLNRICYYLNTNPTDILDFDEVYIGLDEEDLNIEENQEIKHKVSEMISGDINVVTNEYDNFSAEDLLRIYEIEQTINNLVTEIHDLKNKHTKK